MRLHFSLGTAIGGGIGAAPPAPEVTVKRTQCSISPLSFFRANLTDSPGLTLVTDRTLLPTASTLSSSARLVCVLSKVASTRINPLPAGDTLILNDLLSNFVDSFASF